MNVDRRLMRMLRVLVITALPMTAHAQPDDPTVVIRAGSGGVGQWTLRSEHLVWGLPVQTDNRHNVLATGETMVRAGLSVLVREGFVIGHYDLYKVPAWVAVRWTREDHDNLITGSFARRFGADDELPTYARAEDDYEFSASQMERGHMARHEDNEAWGEDNTDFGCRMSNIVPQHRDMNGEAWNDIEDLHQEVVVDPTVDIDTVWVISGPIFEDIDGDGVEDPDSFVGNDVAVPQATYKVIGWFDRTGEFQARGYVVRQEDRVRNDPAHYFTAIDDIEAATGLDFFPALPAARAQAIESVVHTTLWGGADDGGGDGGGGGAGGQVRIAALLPNPAGNESRNEAAILRNDGSIAVSLNGWSLRDASGRTWSLFGTLDPGDELMFLRDGQSMAMNNSGDTVELLSTSGDTVHSVTYGPTPEGELVDTASLP